MSRHLEYTPTGQPARARRDLDWWPWAWALVAVGYGWLTWRAANADWPLLVVATSIVIALTAYLCGRGTTRRADQEEAQP